MYIFIQYHCFFLVKLNYYYYFCDNFLDKFISLILLPCFNLNNLKKKREKLLQISKNY